MIAIPAELAAAWRGTLPPPGVEVPEGWTWGDGGVVCDYDRACDDVQDTVPTEYGAVGWVPVAEGRALILDMELTTAVLPTSNGLTILRNYEFEPTVEAAEQAVAALGAEDWKPFPQTITLESGRLFLFDSAFEGAENAEDIEADDGVAVGELAPGEYRIEVAVREAAEFIRLSPA